MLRNKKTFWPRRIEQPGKIFMRIKVTIFLLVLTLSLLGFTLGTSSHVPLPVALFGLVGLSILSTGWISFYLVKPIQDLAEWLTPLADEGGMQSRPSLALPDHLSVLAANRQDEVANLIKKLHLISTNLGQSISHLQTTTAAKERMETELEIGRSIQMDLLSLGPATFPKHEDLVIHALLQPAREVGGDFYDCYFIREQLSYLLREHCYQVCFCIGDTSGKGVPAALFTTVMKTMIKAQTYVHPSPAKALARVNQVISENNPSFMFTTLFVGILNLVNGELTYTNAGHEPPFLIRQDGSVEKLESCHGPAVGVVPEAQYQEAHVFCRAGDLFVAFTDGVTEAMDPEGNLFSEQGFLDILESGQFHDPETLIQLTFEEIFRFQSTAEQADDITLISFKYLGNPVEAEEYSEFSLIQAAISQLKESTLANPEKTL
jgi:sigma-B regulation protein RsbU (phosphoserine phosphatase)